MTAGDPFVNGFTTSGTVALQPIGHNVMLTSIMCSSPNGRIDIGGGYYTVMQGYFGTSLSTSTSLSDWSGSPLVNMKIFMTPTVFISLNSSSTTIAFHYSGVEL